MYLETTDRFNEIITGTSRTFSARMVSDTEIVEGIKELRIESLAQEDTDSISIGGAVASKITVTLSQQDVTLTGKEYELQMGLLVDEEYEWIPMGMYTPQKPTQYDGILSLTAYDRMVSKLSDEYYSAISDYPVDGKDILREIEEQTGVPIDLSNLPDGIMVDKRSLASGDGNEKPLDGYTYRVAIKYLAQLYGKFSIFNRIGVLEFRWYEDSGFSTDLLYEEPVCGEEAYILQKIKCSVEGNSLISGAGSTGITIDNPLMTQEILDDVYGQIGGMQFVPMLCSLFGDIRLDVGDIIKVYKRNGAELDLPIMSLDMEYDGGVKNSVGSYGQTEEEEKATSKSPTAALIEKVNKEFAERLAESSGLFYSEEKQEDGSVIYYAHDKNTLTKSTFVWKFTAEAIGISTDGGETYPYGLDVSGTAILKKIYTVGLNADYINTGCLEARDADGNIVFYVDVDSGNVLINANTFSVKTVKTDKGTLTTLIDGNTWSAKYTDLNGEEISGLQFDFEKECFIFKGSGNFSGELDIGNGNFVVDANGNMTAKGDTRIYGGKYYAMDEDGHGGYTMMDVDGFSVYSTDTVQRIKIGFPSGHSDSPFLLLNGGTILEESSIIMKQFKDGMWLGNSVPASSYGDFEPEEGYNGIFISITDSKTYVVSGTSMQSIYTGEAIAKFA